MQMDGLSSGHGDAPEYGPRAVLDERSLEAIVEQFNLGGVMSAWDVGGTYNLNLHIRTSMGEYVIRLYRPWVTRERLLFLHQVKRALHRAEFPVPELVISPAGEAILSHNSRLGEVERFVPHDGIADTWERYAVAVSTLGRLHHFFMQGPHRASIVSAPISNYGTPPQLFEWVRLTAERIERLAGNPEASRALVLCRHAWELLTLLCAEWQGTGRHLPDLLIHGDYVGGNLLFEHEHLVGILDFDFLDVRERVYELAYTLYWMMARLSGEGTPERWPWTYAQEMVSHYNHTNSRPLTSGEIRALPVTMARVPLYWVGEAAFIPGDPIAQVLSLAEGITAACWLWQHRQEVAEMLEGSS